MSYQDWAAARSCRPCLTGHVEACAGTVPDPDEPTERVTCLCGCGANNSRVIPQATDSRRTSKNAGEGNVVPLSTDSHLVRGDE